MAVNVNDVLQKVNAGRVALGLSALDSIPRGKKGSSTDCPLARAFRDLGVKSVGGGSVSGLSTKKAFQFAQAVGGEVTQHNGDATVANPSEFRAFVQQFDDGYFPQFVASSCLY